MAKANVLVVEDEQIVAADIRNKLRAAGFAVAGIASSGKNALELA
jgi:CheY-like chemotaxis protein